MTTYATSATHQHPQPGGPPAPPPQNAGGPPAQLTSRPRRAGIVAAAGAFVIAAAATVGTAVALGSPITPAQHTVSVVTPPPSEFNGSEIQLAKADTCAAWDTAARSTARASRESAAALGAEPDSQAPASAAALAMEKRTGMAAIAYLRANMAPATPQDISGPIDQWIRASVDEMHAMNQRDWDEAERVQQRGNDLADVIAPACGLR